MKKEVRNIFVIFLSLLVCGNVFGNNKERVRRRLPDGKYRFFEKVDETKYDERGNKIFFTTENYGGYLIEHNCEYDKNNNLIRDNDYYYTYDANGRLLQVKDKSLYKDEVIEAYKYDNQGRMIESLEDNSCYEDIIYYYEYNSQGVLCKKTKKGSDKFAEFDYDERGNLIYERDPFCHDLYSGQYTKEFIYEYDDRNNLISVINSNNEETKYIYDDNNNLIKELHDDDDHKDLFYEYDDCNRLISKKNGRGYITESYKYNDDGLVVEKQNDDEVILYTYNENNLVDSETVTRYGNSDKYIYEYEYYDNGKLAKVTKLKSI